MIELDAASLLVHAKGAERLADLEATLALQGLTLDLERLPDLTVAEWLETGAEGARSAWLDPADHLVAGITTDRFSIKPAPRRAVGPDLLSIVLGCRGQFVQIESVWLRVHRLGEHRPAMSFDVEREVVTGDEQRLFDAIKTAFFR
jgi:alkyldihydroxyacetonephosphate synthase